MTHRIFAALLLAVVAIGGIALVSVRVAPNAPVSRQLTPYLESAPDRARSSMGLAGLFPARLVEARCSEDGRAADHTFESGLASIRSYAIIGFASPEDRHRDAEAVRRGLRRRSAMRREADRPPPEEVDRQGQSRRRR